MTSLYALVFIVYVQSYQAAFPIINRLEISSQYKTSEEQCEEDGKLFVGVLLNETKPDQQFAWQDFKCVSLENK